MNADHSKSEAFYLPPGPLANPGPAVQEPPPAPSLQLPDGVARSNGQGRVHHAMFVDGAGMAHDGSRVDFPADRLPQAMHGPVAVEEASGGPLTRHSGGACLQRMWDGHLQTSGNASCPPEDRRILQEGVVPAYANCGERRGAPILPKGFEKSDAVNVVKHSGLAEYSQSAPAAHSLRSAMGKNFMYSPQSAGGSPFTLDRMDDLDGEAASLLPRDLLLDMTDAAFAPKPLPAAPAGAHSPYLWRNYMEAGALPGLRPPCLGMREGQTALAWPQGGMGGANPDDEPHFSRSSMGLYEVQPWAVDRIPMECGLFPFQGMVQAGHHFSGRQQLTQGSQLGCDFNDWSSADAWRHHNHGRQEAAGQQDGAVATHPGFGFATNRGGCPGDEKGGASTRSRGPPPGFPSITPAVGIDAP